MIEQTSARFSASAFVNAVQGGQFVADVFTDAVLGKGSKLRMDGRGEWRDNAFVEKRSVN